MLKQNIISNDFNSKVLKTFGVVLFISISLLFISRLVGYYEKASVGNLDPSLIFPIIFLRLPDFLSFLVPFSLFLSLLINVSRMYESNQIYAIFNSGTSSFKHAMLLWRQFILFTLLVLCLSLYIGPYTKSLASDLSSEPSLEDQIQTLQPHILNNIQGTNSVLLFKDKNQNLLKSVIFISDTDDGFMIIESSSLGIKIQENYLDLRFTDGTLYPNLNQKNQVEVQFNTFTHQIILPIEEARRFSFSKILDFSKQASFIELQWRTSFILMLINLIFLAFIFGRINPRSSGFSQFVPGLVIYVLYLSCLILFRESYDGGPSFLYLALWPVHILFLLIALLVVKSDSSKILNLLGRDNRKIIVMLLLSAFLFWILK